MIRGTHWRARAWVVLLTLFSTVEAAEGQTHTVLYGQVAVLGERKSDRARPVAEVEVTVLGAAPARTNRRGRFRLGLPFPPGTPVTLEVDHPGYVIYHPYRGELHLPRPAAGEPPKRVRIDMLPEGSRRLLDDYTFGLLAEQFKREAVDALRPGGRPEEIDFGRYLVELGRRLGFSLEDVERGLMDWQTRKESDPETAPYDLGLVAMTRKDFAEARRQFRLSRMQHQAQLEAELLEEERRRAEVEQRLAERRRLILRDLRAEGNAAYLAYDFAGALGLFQQALERTQRASDPDAWAEVLVDVGNSHRQLGIRAGGADARRHLAEAVAAYRRALRVYTRELLPQDWAMTQNNLGNALGNQGTRTGGEDGRRLLAEAREAYLGALAVYRAAGAGHYVGIIERNLAHTELFLADDNDPDIQLTRGVLYARGDGVPQDDTQAVTWLSKAARQGHGQAQLFLGVMRLSGRGAAQDPVSGYAWIHLAAENGVEQAVQAREQLRQQMEPQQIEAAEALARELRDAQPPAQ
jgi:TPR repeat protein